MMWHLLFVCTLLAAPQVVHAIDSETGTTMGIGLNCVGSVMAASALVIQKTTHMADAELDEKDRTPMYCRPKWYIGVCLLALSGMMEAWSLAFTSLAIVAPLSGLTVVFNTILAVIILKEKTDRREITAMALIVIGIGATCAFGPREGQDYNHSQLENMWKGCQFNDDNKGPKPDGNDIAYYANDCQFYVIAVYFSGVLVIWSVSAYGIWFMEHWPRLNALSYASLASNIGSQQQLFLKCAVELLYATFDGNNQTSFAQFYIYWILVICMCVCQILFLNKGLSRHNAVSYVPLYQSMLVVYSTTAGGIFFDEFGKFDVLQAIMFAVGITLVSIGLLMFTMQNNKDCEEADGDKECEDDGIKDGAISCELGDVAQKKVAQNDPAAKADEEVINQVLDVDFEVNPVRTPQPDGDPINDKEPLPDTGQDNSHAVLSI